MKKIFYFIASAIVALGAVACQNDIEESINAGQQTEGLSIKVTIDDQTRVSLGEFEEGMGRKLTFTEGDVLVMRSEWQKGTNYIFEYTQGEGDLYTFTCTDEGVSELVGTRPCVIYLGGLHEQADALKSYGIICNTAKESIEGVGLYANATMQQSTFGAEDYVINMVAMPLLKFTATEAVTFTSDSAIFFVNGWANEYTTTTTGEIYLPTLTSSGNDCTVTVTTESGFNKSFTKILEENKIYNLGSIEVPKPVASVNGVEYFTLQEAVNAAAEGGEVTILKYVGLTELVTVSGNVTITGRGNNGSVDIYGENCDIFQLTDGATLTLNDIFINSISDCGIFTSAGANDVTVNINNSTVRTDSSGYAAIQFNGTTTGVTLNVSESTITNYNNIAIYLPAGGEYNFYEGVKVYGRTAIYLKGGELNITDGTFVSAHSRYYKEYTTDNNGAIDTGDVIVIESSTYPAAPPTANISGGTFTFSGAVNDKAKSIAHYIAAGVAEADYATISVTGGTFYTDPTDFVADGYVANVNGEGLFVVEEAPVASEYGIVGSFQGWDVAAGKPTVMYEDADGWVVAKGVELYKDEEIKFVKGNSWNGSLGLKTAGVVAADTETAVTSDNGQNIKVATNGKFNIYLNPTTKKFKYTVAEEYTDLMVNITIIDQTGWSDLKIILKDGDNYITAETGDAISGNTYAVSGNYIGKSLTYQFVSGANKTVEGNVTIAHTGANVTATASYITLTFVLDTDNTKQWWGNVAYIYIWNTDDSVNNGWPGAQMTYKGNYTFEYNIPASLAGKKLTYIINNGGGWQSGDSTLTLNADGNTVKGSSIGIK